MQNESSALIPDVIQVYAGADRSVCTNQNLLMSDLQATITGDISDGDWLVLVMVGFNLKSTYCKIQLCTTEWN
ncbi:MAG: hypothetical protein IPJ39_13390 [Saprospiraceae bacterium]|nr:hypothetical protein [Saprospiraceae bacterium]